MRFFIIVFILFLFGCVEERICFDSPEPPNGPPDKEEYINMVSFERKTFIYDCYKDKYIEIEYTRYNGFCWEKSRYVSIPCDEN